MPEHAGTIDAVARDQLTNDEDGRVIAFARSGVLAGLVSVLAFTALHEILISDIRFMLVPMLVAGALSGLCVAWTYTLLVLTPSPGSWLRYNLAYLALFVGVGLASVAVFEPIATIAELTAMSGAPGDLIGQSMPLNLASVVVGAVLVTRLFGGRRRHLGPVLLTVGVLVLFLGHNVSIIGLVGFGASELYLLAKFAGLIAAINAVYALAFLALEGRQLEARPEGRLP